MGVNDGESHRAAALVNKGSVVVTSRKSIAFFLVHGFELHLDADFLKELPDHCEDAIRLVADAESISKGFWSPIKQNLQAVVRPR